jgi:sigma-E factor negative regulatory protein RseA
MNTNNMDREGRESISALVDGELSDEQVEMLLSALPVEGREAWDVYHQIGDVMRSDDMAQVFSTDFSARMAARLDAEPVIVAPVLARTRQEATPPSRGGSLPRFGLPVAAVAALVLAAFVGPRLWNSAPNSPPGADVAAATGLPQAATRIALNERDVNVGTNVGTIAGTAGQPAKDVVMLRDPRIDEYLMAHQRYSPSLYSTAQYAHPAAYVSDSDQ